MQNTFSVLLTGDWEITEERIPSIDPVVDAIVSCYQANGHDLFVFTGDLLREFTPKTVAWARDVFERIALVNGRAPVLLVGNHDWAIGLDKLSAILGSDNDGSYDIIAEPTVRQYKKTTRGREGEQTRLFRIAYLPAPDRSKIGAITGPQGPRERDVEISRALEAAVMDLELHTMSQPAVNDSIIQTPTAEDHAAMMERSMIVFHGTVDTALFGKKPAAGLTWELDASRLKRWGMAIGGHLHEPIDVDEKIHYTGTILPDTFGIKAETFRILEVTLGDGAPELRPLRLLPRALVQIEIPIGPFGIEDETGAITSPFDLSGDLAAAIHAELLGRGLGSGDVLRLKLRLKLPKSDLALFDDEKLFADLKKMLWATPGAGLQELLVKREESASHKSRLEGAENATSLSIDELIRQWAGLSGLGDHPSLELAVDLVRSSPDFQEWATEGTLGVEPLVTEIHNFRQWGDVIIDWRDLKGAVAITGDNATGKTNVAEAPLFAWYKRTPSSADLKDELRRGCSKGFVRQDWISGGKTYRVVRTLERNTKDEVSCKSELFAYVSEPGPIEGRWEPVVERSADVDKEIAKIIGPYDFVVSTFFGTQDQIDNLVQATPTTWHGLIMEALSLRRFEDMRKVASAGSKKAGDLHDRLENEADMLDKAIATRREELQELDVEASKATVDDLLARIHEVEDGIAASRRVELEINTRIGALRSEISATEEKQRKIRELERRVSLGAPVDPGPAPEDPGDPAKLELMKAELADLKKRRDEGEGRFRSLRGALVLIDDEIARLKERFEDNQKILLEREAELQELRQKEGSLEVPCDGLGHMDKIGRDFEARAPHLGPLKASCSAWAAISSGRAIAALEERQRQLQEKIDEIRKAWSEAVGGRGDKAGDVGRAEAELQALDLAHRMLAETVQGHDAKRHALELWKAARESYDMALERRAEILREIEELKAKVDLVEEKDKELRALGIQANEITLRNRREQQTIDAARETIDGIRKKLAANEALAGRLHEDELALEKKRKERDEQQIIFRAWELLTRAFHGTGIPFLLMERALPQIEAEANRILGPTDLTLRIETQRSTQEGKIKDEVNVTFTDPRGTFTLRSSSGAQRAKIGLAGRFALAKVGTEFWGRVPQVFIQDEGWDRFHETRLGEAAEIIRSIARVFKRFVFITHVTKLAEAADIRLRTRASQGESFLEVVG